MPTRPVSLQPGCFYHLFNRGVGKQPIFYHPENWYHFLRLMRQYFLVEKIEILAYCLMPNHYHLLVAVHKENVSEKVLGPFGIAYVKSVNKQLGRVGPLFQDRFQSRIVPEVGYLLRLSCYIHLNSVRAGLVQKPEDWVFSSYQDYIGIRNGTLARKELILEQCGSGAVYKRFVEEQIMSDEEELKELVFDENDHLN